MDELLTTGAVAARLGVSVATVVRLTERGLLASQRLPSGARVYRPADVERVRPALALRRHRWARYHAGLVA